jgi:ribonuclease III
LKTVDYSPLYRALNYQFQNENLLQVALTHRSAGNPNNERLEFLGDALLGLIIAEALFQRFPKGSEGALTRLRASLVKRDTLAEIAQRHLQLSNLHYDYLRLGSGEQKSGGWRRSSILADALEAIIGAIYLDSGIDKCKMVVLRLFAEHLQPLSLDNIVKDPKTRLQEHLQAKQEPLPHYRLLKTIGESPNQQFIVGCEVSLLKETVTGSGTSRRQAEQAAAQSVLDYLVKI